jgi:hypothetical protein
MRLLRAMTGLRFISPDNWQQYWTRTFNDQLWQQYSLLTVEIPGRDGKQEEPTEPAFVNGDDFWQLTLTDKVWLLFSA